MQNYVKGFSKARNSFANYCDFYLYDWIQCYNSLIVVDEKRTPNLIDVLILLIIVMLKQSLVLVLTNYLSMFRNEIGNLVDLG